MERGISVLIKPASGLCNMHCDYCFYKDETAKREQASYGFMSEETLRQVVRKMIPHAEQSISFAFQGGEPTLRGLDFFRRVIELERQYNRRGISISNALQTNGYGIDEEWCDFLRENRFLVGLSVDGTRDTHDLYRHSADGNPTFDRICGTAGLFDAYGVVYNILTVVHREVAKHIEEIYAFYQEQGWRYQQYILCLDPLGEAHGQTGYAVTPEEYGDFLIRLFRLWYRDALKGEQPYIRQFENWAGILMGYLPESCDMRGTCGLQYVVEANGGVYPCDFFVLDDFSLGNLNDCRYDDLEQKRREIGFVERSKHLTESCLSCEYNSVCRGGCQRNRDLTPDGLYKNYFCEGYRMFFDACLDDLKKLVGSLWKL